MVTIVGPYDFTALVTRSTHTAGNGTVGFTWNRTQIHTENYEIWSYDFLSKLGFPMKLIIHALRYVLRVSLYRTLYTSSDHILQTIARKRNPRANENLSTKS